LQISRNASRGLTYVVIVVMVVAGAQLLVSDVFGASPVYVVVSKSMVPTLQVGDLVITQKQPFSSIHVGQVIIYQQPTVQGTCPNPSGLVIVHRVVNVTSAGLITQGDDRRTNPIPDEPYDWPPIPPACVKGVVALAIPYVGLISMVIPYPWNYALVALILLFVFLSEIGPREEKEEGGASGSGPQGRG
jgi:signal peptidase I